MARIVSVSLFAGVMLGAMPPISAAADDCPLLQEMPAGEVRRICNYPCAPTYPPKAHRDGIEGEVILEVTVSASGSPSRVAIAVRSEHGELNKAAVRLTKESVFPRYKSGSKLGTASCYRILHPVKFKLETPEEN